MGKYYKHPTSLMAGPEKELMSYFIKQIKKAIGLTSAIERNGGINGKWINPEKPYELQATKMMRMLVVKTLYLDEDEYIRDALEFRQFTLDFCKAHDITLNSKSRHTKSTVKP